MQPLCESKRLLRNRVVCAAGLSGWLMKPLKNPDSNFFYVHGEN